jgi:hypothetical protein
MITFLDGRVSLERDESIFFRFNNFDNIPANLTGCEKRCYCENGEVLCQVRKKAAPFGIYFLLAS